MSRRPTAGAILPGSILRLAAGAATMAMACLIGAGAAVTGVVPVSAPRRPRVRAHFDRGTAMAGRPQRLFLGITVEDGVRPVWIRVACAAGFRPVCAINRESVAGDREALVRLDDGGAGPESDLVIEIEAQSFPSGARVDAAPPAHDTRRAHSG